MFQIKTSRHQHFAGCLTVSIQIRKYCAVAQPLWWRHGLYLGWKIMHQNKTIITLIYDDVRHNFTSVNQEQSLCNWYFISCVDVYTLQICKYTMQNIKIEKTFHSQKCIWKYRLRNGGHFVRGEMSENTLMPGQNESCQFSWMQIYKFWFSFQWSLFIKVPLMISLHSFGWWIDAKHATSYNLNQWWHCSRAPYGVTRTKWVKLCNA